jgi:two-component system, OmpR family, alkaline phosphatase synthesis response regulator PhoP
MATVLPNLFAAASSAVPGAPAATSSAVPAAPAATSSSGAPVAPAASPFAPSASHTSASSGETDYFSKYLGTMHARQGTMNTMIYYIEDETNIRELVLYALKQAGIEARGFAQAEPFWHACNDHVPDLVLLDIMLPGDDGMAILAKIRRDARFANVPVMMLTAKGAEYDKVLGLDAGADDYLAKPFGMMELVSRVNALLRRSAHWAEKVVDDALTCGVISLSPSAHEVRVNGVVLELTLKEFELLQKLLKERGHALSRSQLLEDVWGVTFVGETRTVDTHVQTLRKKLNDACPGAGDIVQTVRGVGYRAKAVE